MIMSAKEDVLSGFGLAGKGAADPAGSASSGTTGTRLVVERMGSLRRVMSLINFIGMHQWYDGYST